MLHFAVFWLALCGAAQGQESIDEEGSEKNVESSEMLDEIEQDEISSERRALDDVFDLLLEESARIENIQKSRAADAQQIEVTQKPTANPYTYAVTGSAVTTASPLQFTPSPVLQQSPPSPAPFSDILSYTIEPHPPNFHFMTPVPGYTPYPTKSPYGSSPAPVSPSSTKYPLPPMPTYSPQDQHLIITPAPISQSQGVQYSYDPKPTTVYHQNVFAQDSILKSASPGPFHHQPIRQAPVFSVPAASPNQIQSFQNHLQDINLFTTNFTDNRHLVFSSVNDVNPGAVISSQPSILNTKKPAIQFQDNLGTNAGNREFVPMFDEKVKSNERGHSIPTIFTAFDKSKDLTKQIVSQQPTKKPRFLLQTPTPAVHTNLVEEPSPISFNTLNQFATEPQFSPFLDQRPAVPASPLVPTHQVVPTIQPFIQNQAIQNFPLAVQNPRAPQKLQPARNPVVPTVQQLPRELNSVGFGNEAFQQNPALVPQQNALFQSINELAAERPVHSRIDPSQMHHMRKDDALRMLMDIAGDNWDAEISIEKNLVDTGGAVDYQCPFTEGHFPDTKKCSVYYQCSNGTPTKHTCQPGLAWNMLTNQCDWEANVDCRLNTNPGILV